MDPTSTDEYKSTAHFDQARTRCGEAVIGGADENGEFEGSWLHELILGDTLLIVPDANIILQDLARSCEKGRRGTLIGAANSGVFRLFCAEHVIDDTERNLAKMAALKDKPLELYVERWNAEYLPMLRVIRSTGLPKETLSPDERARPHPPEDTDSIALALQLGAFFLTEDQAAWRAVYGTTPRSEELRRWVPALLEGHEAGELGRLVTASSAFTTLTIVGIGYGLGQLYKKAPWVLAAGSVALALLAINTRRKKYEQIGSTLWEMASNFNEAVYSPYTALIDRFAKRAPTISAWEELEQTNAKDNVLARACLYYLARSMRGAMTATEISQKLQFLLSIGTTPQRVGKILRAHPNCFFEPRPGRWQVGVTLAPLP